VSTRSNRPLRAIPLGGLGEFGMHTMLFTYGEDAILVDAGVLFANAELPGVDLIVPDLTCLEDYRLLAIVLTHGHEDHIGGVPYVLAKVQTKVYGTPFTLALLKPKLEERNLTHTTLIPVSSGEKVTIGPFEVEFIRVTHNIPDCAAICITTPAGRVIHTGDYKVDHTPLDGERFDLPRLAELGREGVLALFGDSTNIERVGISGSEIAVVDAFEELLSSTQGKLFVAMFSSSLYRAQVLVNLAEQFNRKVVFLGRSMIRTTAIASQHGHLTIPMGLQIADSSVSDWPSEDILCICTGSQGEPRSALARIAVDGHPHVRIRGGDVVVFSAREIPGNEKAIGRVMDHVVRRGAQLVHEGTKHVHVSGHASEEEIKLVLSLVRPKYLIPIHGEYRQLARHAAIASEVSPDTVPLTIENGQVIEFWGDCSNLAGKVPAGRVLIDATRSGEVADEVLRDRRHLAGDGLVVAVVAINRQTGALVGDPELVARGFVVGEGEADSLFKDAAGVIAECIDASGVEERGDQGLMTEKLRGELRRFFKKRSGRRPLVLPVLMEI